MAEKQKVDVQQELDEKVSDEEVLVEDMPEENTGTDDEENTATEQTDEIDETEQEEAKKGFFGKKKEKKDKKDIQIEELADRLKRNLAEFENYRKRTEKEKASMYEIGAREFIEKILPVVDNFERGLASVSAEEKESAFVEGMEKVYNQLASTMEDAGVSPIEAIGNEFNPDFHNAVMHVEEDDAGENLVIEEFQKGYTYRGTVVRHSMVKVVN